MFANTVDFNLVNKVVCDELGIDVCGLYGNNKKSKAHANAFGYILYYLHVEKNVPISALEKEYKRSKRLIFYHIAKQRDFIKIYCTTREEYNKILCALDGNK